MTLVPFDPLPKLPVVMHPTGSEGVVEDRLMLRPGCDSAEASVAELRSTHSAEKSRFLFCTWLKPISDEEAILLFIPSFEPCAHIPLVKCPNDPLAAQVALANSKASAYYTGVRWEIYEDPEMEDIVGMGRFDQWDFLAGIDPDELARLSELGLSPRGDWDFDKMIWRRRCSGCGDVVGVNSFAYNIDSAVCKNCMNRPFLAPSISDSVRFLASSLLDDDQSLKTRQVNHVLGWLLGVGASIQEIKLGKNELTPPIREQIAKLWQKSLGGRVLNSKKRAEICSLIERKAPAIDPGVFESCSRQVEKALLGHEPFGESHRIAASLVLSTAELVETKLITTS